VSAQHRTSWSESTGYAISFSNQHLPLLPHRPKKWLFCDTGARLGDSETKGGFDGALEREGEGAIDDVGTNEGGDVGVSEGRIDIDGTTEGETDSTADGTTVGISVGSPFVDDQIKAKSWPHPDPAPQFCSSSSFVQSLPLLSAQIASAEA